MNGKIRLTCQTCDREDFDRVDVFPNDWTDIDEIQSLAESLREVDIDDHSRTVFEWYTHLGTCPDCQEKEDAPPQQTCLSPFDRAADHQSWLPCRRIESSSHPSRGLSVA